MCVAPNGRTKRRFRDHKEAVRALHGSKRLRNNDLELNGFSRRDEKRVYKCQFCNGWHLTKQEPLIRMQDSLALFPVSFETPPGT